MESSFFLAEESFPTGPATIRTPVKLGLADGRVLNADIYLLCDSVRPAGITTIESTLDGVREFIPVNVEGDNVLLARSAVRFVEFPPEAPGAPDLQDVGGTLDVVKLRMDSGEVLSGVLCFPAPESMRMSDVFNHPGRFLTLSSGDHMILVSKAHIVEASF